MTDEPEPEPERVRRPEQVTFVGSEIDDIIGALEFAADRLKGTGHLDAELRIDLVLRALWARLLELDGPWPFDPDSPADP